MDASEIIKRRLAELKRMSIELKESTENSNEVDYNIVYSILEATKTSASKLSELKETESRASRSSSPLSKLLSMNSTQPYKTLFPETPNEQKQKSVNGQNSSSKAHKKPNKYPQDRQYNSQPYQEPFYSGNEPPFDPQTEQFIGTFRQEPPQMAHSSQQQVLSLKQENSHLEQSLSSLRNELHELKDKLTSLQKQQQWKAGLPYFKLTQKISAFYTRMKIHESDYHKIDYLHYDAELTLNKLIINKPNSTQKELDLSELRQVHYVDSIAMFLHFGMVETDRGRNSGTKDQSKHEKTSNQDFFENLFIKFANEEELHQWDLALYINFKIVDSLKKDKLFQAHLRHSRSKSPKRSSSSKKYNSHDKYKRSSDNIIEDEEDLMKKLIERRQLYQETKKLVSERMIEKANQKKLLQSSGAKRPAKDELYDEIEEFSETQPFEIGADEEMVSSKGKFNYVVRDENGYQDTEGEKSERANTSKFKDLYPSGKINFSNGEMPPIPPITQNGVSLTLNDRGASFNPAQHQLSLSRKLEDEKVKQANELKRQEQLKVKKTQQIIKKLVDEGYDLTKYSKDGFNPHEKRFFLSSDLKELCWEEEGAKNKKSIKLDSIKQVMLQKIGEGIRKHIKKPKREEHCIISYFKEGKMKVIELGANSTVMAQFVDELITVIDHLKEGPR